MPKLLQALIDTGTKLEQESVAAQISEVNIAEERVATRTKKQTTNSLLSIIYGGEGGIRSCGTWSPQRFRRDRNRQNPPDPLEMPVSGTKQVQRNPRGIRPRQDNYRCLFRFLWYELTFPAQSLPLEWPQITLTFYTIETARQDNVRRAFESLFDALKERGGIDLIRDGAEFIPRQAYEQSEVEQLSESILRFRFGAGWSHAITLDGFVLPIRDMRACVTLSE
jgi:hypothetical protein